MIFHFYIVTWFGRSVFSCLCFIWTKTVVVCKLTQLHTHITSLVKTQIMHWQSYSLDQQSCYWRLSLPPSRFIQHTWPVCEFQSWRPSGVFITVGPKLWVQSISRSRVDDIWFRVDITRTDFVWLFLQHLNLKQFSSHSVSFWPQPQQSHHSPVTQCHCEGSVLVLPLTLL